MKNIIIPFVVLMATMSMNAQIAIKVSKNDEEVKVFQNTSSSTYRVDFERAEEGNKTGVSGGHSWTQLWRGGPKFADFNIGARITDYSQAQGTGSEWGKAPYTIENCGFHFAWGGFKDDFYDHLSSTTENLAGSNDEATMLWNNSWRLPTMEEFRCLLDGIEFTIDNRQSVIKGTYCTWEWMVWKNNIDLDVH